jgi:hypothetical protein
MDLNRFESHDVRIRIATDLDECRALWQAVTPMEVITDLWEVRDCFHRYFKRPLNFIVVEDAIGIAGLLPLSYVDEFGCMEYFPGETWQGRTWLEQNRIHRERTSLKAMLSRCRRPYELRYLLQESEHPDSESAVDEIGYLFSPPHYDYDIRNYYAEFSHKSIKQILREVAAFEKRGVTFRCDDIDDFDLMIRLNVGRFGKYSYFYDGRFRESFRSLAHWLRANGYLRLTTVLVDNEPAAVDMGSIYRNVYTVMAGGTDARFPGIAKLINLHHIERACRERWEQVDFLCGDFNWKKMFHLTPRPLFLLSNLASDISAESHPVVTLHAVNFQ